MIMMIILILIDRLSKELSIGGHIVDFDYLDISCENLDVKPDLGVLGGN